MIKCKKPGCEQMVSSVFFFVFAHTILDGHLYTIVKLIWKLMQSRIFPNLVLVDILVAGTVHLIDLCSYSQYLLIQVYFLHPYKSLHLAADHDQEQLIWSSHVSSISSTHP